MKKKSRKLLCVILALCMLATGGIFSAPICVQAATKTVNAPGEAVKDGKYIYYAYEMSGVRMGIMRYDTSKKTKKQITTYKNKGKGTNGFYSLNVDSKYIYATWNQGYGSSDFKEYIYRFSKDGKTKKKLAVGDQPVVIGNYIYYVQKKMVNTSYGLKYTQNTGYICRMKKDGSGKKRVYYHGTNVSPTLYANGTRLLYMTSSSVFYDLKGNSYPASGFTKTSIESGSTSGITKGNFRYYTRTQGGYGASQTKLCRQNLRTGKVKVLATFRSGIPSVRILGNYIMLKGGTLKKRNGYDQTKFYVYCMRIDGKKKKALASWWAAE